MTYVNDSLGVSVPLFSDYLLFVTTLGLKGTGGSCAWEAMSSILGSPCAVTLWLQEKCQPSKHIGHSKIACGSGNPIEMGPHNSHTERADAGKARQNLLDFDSCIFFSIYRSTFFQPSPPGGPEGRLKKCKPVFHTFL